jgi:hypothetical protein
VPCDAEMPEIGKKVDDGFIAPGEVFAARS